MKGMHRTCYTSLMVLDTFLWNHCFPRNIAFSVKTSKRVCRCLLSLLWRLPYSMANTKNCLKVVAVSLKLLKISISIVLRAIFYRISELGKSRTQFNTIEVPSIVFNIILISAWMQSISIRLQKSGLGFLIQMYFSVINTSAIFLLLKS